MSKRDHRKKQQAKEALKAAQKAKLVSQYSRIGVSAYEVALKKEKDARFNLFHDLRTLFFPCGTYGFREDYRSLIKTPPDAEEVREALLGHYAIPKESERLHPLIRYADGVYHNMSMTNQERRAMLNLIDISKRTKFFNPHDNRDNPKSNRFIDGLFSLAKTRALWERMPDLWQPKDVSDIEQFCSLVQHLFAKYPMPRFFDKVWLNMGKEAEKQQMWYVNVANGSNIRTQTGLPISLTKKVAHFMMQAPERLTFNQAIRYGQVISMGGNINVVLGVLSTPLGEIFDNDDFWQTVIKFFIENPLLDRSHYRSVYDFIFDQKYRNMGFVIQDGVQVQAEPPQPNFCMKGREPNTLLQMIERWHRELGDIANRPVLGHNCWKSCGIQMYTEKICGNAYYIRELLCQDELWQDGKDMHHCVGSYGPSCASGEIAIFSLSGTEKETMKNERMATIEVSLRDKTVVQVRARFNLAPSPMSWKIIKNWMGYNGFKKAY